MDRGSADDITRRAADSDAEPGHPPGRRAPGGQLGGAGLALGVALLAACTATPPPTGPFALGGPLLEALAAPARAEPLVVGLRLAIPAPVESDSPTARAPLPVLRPALAVRLPPPAKPQPPDPEPQVAWLPKLKPAIERGAASILPPEVPWPPPPKPRLALLPGDLMPAAGPAMDEPAHLSLREDHLGLPPRSDDRGRRPEPAQRREPGKPGARPITIEHGATARPEADDAIAVGNRDQRVQRLDRAAREALLAGDAAGALTLYERLAAEAPEARAARLGQAIALQQLGRLIEARAVYQSLLQADPEDLGAKIALIGMVAERAPDEALPLFRRLARHHPDDHRLPAQIAMVLARTGDLAGAISAQRRAVALAPANPGYRANLAVLLDRAGQLGAAVEQYRSALELATLGGAPTAQLDAIAARLHHLRAQQRLPAASQIR